jgi:polyisoprenoid-binding protein YceI
MTRALSMAILVLILAAAASADTWTVTGDSEVVFTSKAPMESFDGRTDQVQGHIAIDPGDLSSPLDLRIAVDLASLDTGIGMRNTHMRERHLETDQYPEAVFTAGEIRTMSLPELTVGEPVVLLVSGQFDLHGVTRPLEIPANVNLAADGTLTVACEFQVKLSDHDIDRPKFLVMKLADEQQVKVTLTARKESP